MPDINDWIQLPGRSIDHVRFSTDERVLSFQLSNRRCSSSSEYVAFESSERSLPLLLFSAQPESEINQPLDPMVLLGRTIEEISVPYVLPGLGLETYLEIRFEDGLLVRVMSEDPTIPVRIS